MIVESGDLEIPETGGFSRRIKPRFAFAFFFFLCFSFLFFSFVWVCGFPVAQHERESGGAHVVKCDMFGSGLAPVGDEICICPGDLSRLLALGFFVRQLFVQGLVIPVRPGWLSFGITTRIWEIYLFE